MGGNSTKPKDHQNVQHSTRTSGQDPGRNLRDTKKVLFVHQSKTKEQELVVRNFRDALTYKANGSVKVELIVNMADPSKKDTVKDSSWLDEVNNVILLCLKSEAISLMEQMIKEKNYVKDGLLNGKVFSVSFGQSSQWPPEGIQKGTDHARDFAFEFENVDCLTPIDFESSDRMTALVAAIKGT